MGGSAFSVEGVILPTQYKRGGEYEVVQAPSAFQWGPFCF